MTRLRDAVPLPAPPRSHTPMPSPHARVVAYSGSGRTAGQPLRRSSQRSLPAVGEATGTGAIPGAEACVASVPGAQTSAVPARTARIAGLDAARAVAVMAMVFGHTMDAVLSEEARQVPWVAGYWHVRNFTAPLFLFVSGWVLLTVLARTQLRGLPVMGRFLPRVGLLFALGYLLRFPVWDLGGVMRLDPELWRHLSTFDALQCIAASILLALVVCTLVSSTLARLGLFALLGTGAVLFAPRVWAFFASAPGGIPTPWAQTFGGGDARFTLFPWAGYFLAGAAMTLLFVGVQRRWVRTLCLVAAGVALLVALPGERPSLPDSDPLKFLWRLGPVMLLVAGMLELPEALTQWLAPIGRASLWTYVIHLPIAYGWAWWPGLSSRVGRTLSDVSASVLAVGVVVFSVSLALLARRLFALPKWRSPWNAVRTRLGFSA